MGHLILAVSAAGCHLVQHLVHSDWMEVSYDLVAVQIGKNPVGLSCDSVHSSYDFEVASCDPLVKSCEEQTATGSIACTAAWPEDYCSCTDTIESSHRQLAFVRPPPTQEAESRHDTFLVYFPLQG